MGAEVAAIGLGIGIFGQVQASEAASKADRKNAQFLREQAVLDGIAAKRETSIFQREADLFMGDNISLLAKSGVDLSGSLLTQLAFDKQELMSEKEGIILTGQRRIALSGMQARQAEQRSKDVRTAGLYQAGGSLLNAGANYNLNKKSGNTPDGAYSGAIPID